MKKNFLLTAILLTIVFCFTILAGCEPRDELYQLEKELRSTEDIYNNLDNISSDDLSNGMFDNISYAPTLQTISFEPIQTDTILDKVQQAIQLQIELRNKQTTVDQNKLLILSAGQ